MIKYVAGFLFSENGNSVVLIEKNKPDFMKGLLNAVGGKIEEGEVPIDSMCREFKEECGLEIRDWDFFLELCHDDWSVHFYRAFSNDAYKVNQVEDEHVYICSTRDIANLNEGKLMPNLKWLIPMAMDKNVQYSKVYDKGNR